MDRGHLTTQGAGSFVAGTHTDPDWAGEHIAGCTDEDCQQRLENAELDLSSPAVANLVRAHLRTQKRRAERSGCGCLPLGQLLTSTDPDDEKHARVCSFCGPLWDVYHAAEEQKAAGTTDEGAGEEQGQGGEEDDGEPFVKLDSDSGPGPSLEDEIRMYREARTPFEVETGVRPEDVSPSDEGGQPIETAEGQLGG